MDMMAAANALAAEGRDVIRMEVGQPSVGAPASVVEAAEAALRAGASKQGYTEALGRRDLRERIARYYGDTHGLDISPRRIAVTTGSSTGFMLAFLAAFEAGETMGITLPGYPAYPNILKATGLNGKGVRLSSAAGFRLGAEAITPDLDGLLVASPSNPTGTMLGPQELRAIVNACVANKVRFISDEIYHRITFGGAAETALSFSDDVIVINSFSKYYCMTGWRLGWMVVPEHLTGRLTSLAQSLYISPPAVAQSAALAAFECGAELDAIVTGYHRNRDALMAGLGEVGITKIAPPDGGFYLYADVSHLTGDSEAFAYRMLEEAGVAVAPGRDFDADEGHKTIRISFPRAESEVVEGAKRITEWVRGL